MLAVNVLISIMLLACLFVIYLVTIELIPEEGSLLFLVPPLVICGIHFLAPFVFKYLLTFERYEKKYLEEYTVLGRLTFLKFSTLVARFFFDGQFFLF